MNHSKFDLIADNEGIEHSDNSCYLFYESPSYICPQNFSLPSSSIGELGCRSLFGFDRRAIDTLATSRLSGLVFSWKSTVAIFYLIGNILYIVVVGIRCQLILLFIEKVLFSLFAFILCFSPHICTIFSPEKSTNWSDTLSALSSALYLSSVIIIENLIKKQQSLSCLVASWIYYTILVLERQDAIAGTIVYTLSLDSYVNDDDDYFFISRQFPWLSLINALAILNVKNRVLERFILQNNT
jgi:hypothetical protein